MSEQIPSAVRKTPADERDEVARLESELARKKFDQEQKEQFGKYDVGVANMGEDTYESYLEQRPSEGVVRDGDNFRHTETGQFSSAEDYATQLGTAQEYYDRKAGIDGIQTYEAPNYETMNYMQLVKEASKARQLGDKAGEEEIKAAVEEFLAKDALKDDTESSEDAQARYDDELARYEILVDRLANKSEPSEAEAEETAENEPVDDTQEAEKTVETQEEPESDYEETEVLLNGEKVTVENVFVSPDGEKVVKIVDADGKQQLVFESDLEYQQGDPDEAAKAAGATPEAQETPEDGEGEDDNQEGEATEEEGLPVKEGDRVRYTDRDGNTIEGVLESIEPLHNEAYNLYRVKMDDGTVYTVSYVEKVPETGDGKGAASPEAETEDDPGNYSELYAQRKNLGSTKAGQERLEAEGKKVVERMSTDINAQVEAFVAANPEATNEQIRQAAMGFFVEAQNSLEREIIDHIDGVKVDGQESKGNLRRFGAWMDRHGAKIKVGLLIAGGVGLGVATAGIATGAMTIGLVAGVGTAIGAAKGASLGALLQRQGSKNSAAREVSLQSPEAQALLAQLNPADRQTYTAVSQWLIGQYNAAADQDHTANVNRTATAVIVGGALGALAGSIHIETPTIQDITTTQVTPNAAPEIVSHQIQPGELTGQVLDKLIADNNINLPQFLQAHNITGYGDSFTLSDGSTNVPLLHAVEGLGADFGIVGQTHSFAGADALSNDGIRSIFDAVYNGNDWGSTSVDVTTTVTGSEANGPWTLFTAGAASLVGDNITKFIGDLSGRRNKNAQRAA